MNKKGLKRIISSTLVIALLFIVIAVFTGDRVTAILNKDEMVRFSDFSAKNKIPDSTLFIGTYLIKIESLTDELYEKATESAGESGQVKTYYKSEIGDGLWYDVTDAESLEDISNISYSVDEKDLDKLYIQYYVGSDGLVVDVSTGQEVILFDIPEPYKLSQLKELEPLWLYYTGSSSSEELSQDEFLKKRNSSSTGKTRIDVYTYQILSTLFSLDLRDATTDGYDIDMERLYNEYKTLKSQGRDDEAEAVYKVMASVDDARRAVIMDKLAMADPSVIGVLYELATGKYYTSSGSFKNPYSSEDGSSRTSGNEPDYIKELRECLMNVKTDSIKSSDDDDDVAFQQDSDLISALGECLSNCQGSYIDCSANALADDDTILGHAQYQYAMQVINSASADDKALINLRDIINISENRIKNSESEIELLDNSLLDSGENKYEKAVTSGTSSEYRKEKSKGVSDSKLQVILNSDLSEVEAVRSEYEFLIEAYTMRAAAKDGLGYVKGCIDWTLALNENVPNDDFKPKAQESLESHKKWLNEKASEVRTSEESLKTELDKLQDLKKELQKKRDQALDDNDLATAKVFDTRIEAVDREIAREEEKTGETADSTIPEDDEDIDSATSTDADDDGDSDDDDSDSDSDKLSDDALALTEDDIEDILEKKIGKSIDEMEVDDLAIATTAVSRFAKKGNVSARSLAVSMVEKMRSKDSKYLYSRYKKKNPEYVSLKTIGLVTSYRYYFNENKMTATLSKGSKSLIFSDGSNTVISDGEEKVIKYKTVMAGDQYIAEDDAISLMDCYSEYVLNSSYALCITGTMNTKADELVDTLSE